MSGRNSFGSLPATESKSFLRKGQGNGVASGTAGKPTNRTLQLKKPETKDNDPTSYTGIYARQSAPRPVSAPNTPQKSRRQDAAKAGREAAELLLMGMEEGIFTSKSEHSLPTRHTAGGAQLRAAATVRTTASSGASPLKKADNIREVGGIVDDVMASELDRSVVRRRMEGWYSSTSAPSAPVPQGGESGAATTAPDFSPVLAALQGKLATLTQENIGLRGRVAELEDAMASMDDEYRRRMETAMESVSQEKREEVKTAIQAIRVRARQERANKKSIVTSKEHNKIQQIEKELRALKQSSTAAEGVLNLTIEKLLKDKRELQADVRKLHDERDNHQCAACIALRLRCSELEKELGGLAQPKKGGERDSKAKSDIDNMPESSSSSGWLSSKRGAPSVRGRLAGAAAAAAPADRAGAAPGSPPRQRVSSGSPAKDHSPPRNALPMPSPSRGGDKRSSPTVTGTAASKGSPGKGGEQGATRKLQNGAVEVTGEDGSRTITFKDGTVKELTTDGRLVVRFNNGDVKEECADGTVTYFYRDARTTHITYKSGLQLLHFPDNQMEKHYPDGSKEVLFPDKSRRRFLADGSEEVEAII